MELLGYATVGEGARHVIVLHDWMGDHRNYDPMLAYLDRDAFTYAFVDLRGYGLSRGLAGRYDLAEAAGDVVALAAHLGWSRFHLVAHSMSTLVAQEVAATQPALVASLVLITPVPPAGLPTPPAILEAMERIGGDESARRAALDAMWGPRLSAPWLDFKLARWRESAVPAASAGYVRMFAASGISAPVADLPVLAVTCDHDAPHFHEATVAKFLAGYQRRSMVRFVDSGHYPMQELPAALASAIEGFLRAQ